MRTLYNNVKRYQSCVRNFLFFLAIRFLYNCSEKMWLCVDLVISICT